MATFNNTYIAVPGPLTHTPPLFLKLKLLTIFDIYKLQLGKLVYDSLNNIGPTRSIIQLTRTTEVHSHSTRYATQGNFFRSWARTTKFGLINLQAQGGLLWANLPINVKTSHPKNNFVKRLKYKLLNIYSNE